jgi:hypothetical protein
MPSPLPPQPALATDRFILILAALVRWVWEKPGREMTGLVSMAIRRKLTGVQARFAILAQRFHDGTLAPPKPRATPRKPPHAADDAAARTRPQAILPRRFGWLCGLVPSWAAGVGYQMEALLQHPEMEAMAAASPEVGKLIRPLLWMTGRRPPAYLALPPRTGRAPPRRAPLRRAPLRRAGAGPKPGPGRPRAAAGRSPAVAPAPPPAPPSAAQSAPPAALLVTPVIDPDMWSHYSLIPGNRRNGR